MPKLADVAEINPRLDRSESNDLNEVISFVPMAYVSEVLGAITSEEHRELGDVIKGFTTFKDRDVLVAKITPCFENGKIAHARIDKRLGFGSTEFHVVRPATELLDDRYLYHFLRQPVVREDGKLRMTGSGGQKRVPKTFLEELEIPLPPLPEQRRIAAILDKADTLRAKRREAIAKLDQLMQSVFLEMFGDPVKNVHGYPLVSLGDTVEQSRPITYGILMPGPDIAEGVPYVRVVDIRDGKVITASVRRTSSAIAHAYRRSALITGDLLMSIRGHVGRMGVTPKELDGANITQDTARISVNTNFDARYIFGLLSTIAIQRHMELFTRGAAVKGINLKDVREIPVPVPSKSQQLRYGEIIQNLNDLKNTFTRQLGAADRMFHSLQSDVFNVGV